MDIFPASWPAHRLLGRILDADGLWAAAATSYAIAAELASTDGAAQEALALEGRAASMRALAQSEMARVGRACTWVSSTVCNTAEENGSDDGGGCSRLEGGGPAESNATSTGGAEGGGLFLSVVMVSRHDGTFFCRNPVDSCLDRLQVASSSFACRAQ